MLIHRDLVMLEGQRKTQGHAISVHGHGSQAEKVPFSV